MTLRALFRVLLFALCLSAVSAVSAQEPAPEPATPITLTADTDEAIRARIERIYGQIEALSALEIRVEAGVVTLEGTTLDAATTADAVAIASRVEGVVFVQNQTRASVEVGDKVSPFLARLRRLLEGALSAIPLVLVAAILFSLVAAAGWWIAGWQSLWQRLSPNPFIAALVAQAIRAVALVIALVLALNLTGANALLGTVLGGAGVIGLAIGFAVRDSLENYISSIMLSLRQPFRANDHVVIDGEEGKVIRLTSRATILMTLDGNHLRIPNSAVFKAVMLNYTRNPERRFTFQLHIDAGGDPLRAIEIGCASLASLGFVLAKPAPGGAIDHASDGAVAMTFHAWINQQTSDFGQARSAALASVRSALAEAGFREPQPVQRLLLEPCRAQDAAEASPPKPPRPAPVSPEDVRPQTGIDDKVDAERALSDDTDDLLSANRPIE